MKTRFVFEFIKLLLLARLLILLGTLGLLLLDRVVERDAHLRLILRLQLAIGEGIHLLADVGLD